MKVMVLGGGNCQINLIERLKSEGDEVILVDYLANCIASKICNTHIQISTFDTQNVLLEAKKHKIDAIVTLGTDQPVYTAAVVAHEIGLPFYLTPEQALSATNKRIMKKVFSNNAIPTADYRLINKGFDDEEVEDMSFPMVIKPVDSQGQRGIYKVNSIKEIREHIQDTLSFSRENKVLVEKYYSSDEITINGWLEDGKFTMLSVVDRVSLTAGAHIGICIAHNFPSVHLEDKYDEIYKITQKIIKVFEFKNGPIYFQYLIGKDGVKVNEIAMRIGGAYEDVTLPIITGIDVLGRLIDAAKGKSKEDKILSRYNLRRNKVYLSTQMFFLKKGTISSISYNEKKINDNGVTKISIARSIGDIIGGIENATARAGYFLVKARSYKELLESINKVYSELLILDESGKNMVIRYSDYSDRYKYGPDENIL